MAIFFGASILLLFRKEYWLAVVVFISAMGSLGLIIELYLGRKKLLDDFYIRLFTLIASLKLESFQESLSLQKKASSYEDLEFTLKRLESAIESKTNEYRQRNNELKKKQVEILKQNKELVAAYDALSESRDRYEKLVKNLEGEYFFYGTDLKGSILFVSPSVKNILGYTVSEYKQNINKIATKSPLNNAARKTMKQVLQGKEQPRFLMEVLDKACKPHVLEILEIPIYNTEDIIVSVEGLAHDITERYYAEELMREQEEKYRQVFNSASDFMFIYEIKKDGKPGKFIEANEYTLKMLGYTQQELHKKTPEDLVAENPWGDPDHKVLDQKYERIWESKDGNRYNVEISEHLFKVKNKNACIAVARDITDRKRAVEEIQFMNEELINQKENLEALLDNLTQTQEQLVQSEKMAALGQLIAGVAHEVNTPLGAIKASVGNLSDSLDSALKQLPALFQSQSAENLELFLKAFNLARVKKPELSSREQREKKRAIRKELKEHNIESAEFLADLLAYLEIYDDYREIIDMLHNKEALAVLKNVRDFISLLKNTHTIDIASEKASKVVFALKKYAHRDSLGEKVPTDIIDGIETVLTLYDNQLKQGIEVVKKYSPMNTVMCYQDEINQVWTNLIQNAIHAMKQNGILTISAHSDEKAIYVGIADTGEGIEPTVVEKIFDPFFTTKKQGEGSGLGLDIVKKIIDKHGGNISVNSKLGEGTTFIIKIPMI